MFWSKKKSKPQFDIKVTVTDEGSDKIDMGIKFITSDKPIESSSRQEDSESAYNSVMYTTSELMGRIARIKSSPFFPIKDPKLAQKVREEIAESLANSESSNSLKQRLSHLLSDPKTIENIVDTECVYVYSAGLIAFGLETGAIGKEWNATMLKDTCEDCAALDDKRVSLRMRFGAKDSLGYPPLHTGCCCSIRLMYPNEKNLLHNKQ